MMFTTVVDEASSTFIIQDYTSSSYRLFAGNIVSQPVTTAIIFTTAATIATTLGDNNTFSHIIDHGSVLYLNLLQILFYD